MSERPSRSTIRAFEQALSVVPPNYWIGKTLHSSSGVRHRREQSSTQEHSLSQEIQEQGKGTIIDTTPEIISAGQPVGSVLGKVLDIISSGNDIYEIFSGEASLLFKLLHITGKTKGAISKKTPKKWGKIFPEFYEQYQLREKYKERDQPFSTERDIWRIIFNRDILFILSLTSHEKDLLFNNFSPNRKKKVYTIIKKIQQQREYEEHVATFLTSDLTEQLTLPIPPKGGYKKRSTSLYLMEGLLTEKFEDTKKGRKRTPSDVANTLKDVEYGKYGEKLKNQLQYYENKAIEIFITNAQAERKAREIAYQLCEKYIIPQSLSKSLIRFGIPVGITLGKNALVLLDLLPPSFAENISLITNALLTYYTVSFFANMGLGLSEKATYQTIISYLQSDVAIQNIESFVTEEVRRLLYTDSASQRRSQHAVYR